MLGVVRFGRRMLEQMGWAEGGGLGARGQGRADPLRLKANSDARGLGSTHSSDDNWLAHQDSFSLLLQQLNSDSASKTANKTASKTSKGSGSASGSRGSLEARSAASRARIHYGKFMRMKDAAAYSDDAMGSILGKARRAKRKTAETKSAEKEEQKTAEESLESNVSTQSASEHYAQRMAAKLAALGKVAY